MERARPEPAREEEGPELPAEIPALRCPFCHEDLPEGTLASACEACGTFHHLTCFAEHRGCSTPGCGTHRGHTRRVGADAPAAGAPFTCRSCREPCPAEELVAYCPGCHITQHVACYERHGRCIGHGCRGSKPVQIVTPAEARASIRRVQGRALLAFGAFQWLLAAILLVAALAKQDPRDLPVVVAVFALMGAAALAGGLWIRRGAASAGAPPPARPGAPPPASPAKGDAAGQGTNL